jgi:hypothetical protein
MSHAPSRWKLTLPAISIRAATATAALLVTACAGHPARAPAVLLAGSGVVELADTPFYPPDAHDSSVTALATVLSASGVTTAAPDELSAVVHLPPQGEAVQAELQRLPPRYARLAYPLAPDLSAILVEVAGHRPVLVRQNSGAWPPRRSMLSKWNFAVVVGYDEQHDTLVLRSGSARRQVLPARDFLRAWTNADRWAMLVLRPGELPAAVSRSDYLKAAADFEQHGGRPEDSLLAFNAALKRWPDEPLAWSGRAVARLQAGDRTAAARDYATAVRIDGSNVAARNGLALILLDLGCIREAQSEIDMIREYVLPDPLRTQIESSRDRIRARSQPPVPAEPAACGQLSYQMRSEVPQPN